MLAFNHLCLHKSNFQQKIKIFYKQSQNSKILFNHPHGTNDDRFWALAVHARASHRRTKNQKPGNPASHEPRKNLKTL